MRACLANSPYLVALLDTAGRRDAEAATFTAAAPGAHPLRRSRLRASAWSRSTMARRSPAHDRRRHGLHRCGEPIHGGGRLQLVRAAPQDGRGDRCRRCVRRQRDLSGPARRDVGRASRTTPCSAHGHAGRADSGRRRRARPGERARRHHARSIPRSGMSRRMPMGRCTVTWPLRARWMGTCTASSGFTVYSGAPITAKVGTRLYARRARRRGGARHARLA